jgi:segregation and condensation protein B
MPTDTLSDPLLAPENQFDPTEVARIIESLLFVADQPVSPGELAKVLNLSQGQIKQALNQLEAHYQDRYLQVQHHQGRLQLVTAPQATPHIERFLGLSFSTRLSTAALETLGIIAYRQPITRSEIEDIRGVGSDGVLRTLLSKGLIEEVGRLDTVGHPIQYGTTFEFLQYFGLTSLADLPPLALQAEFDLNAEDTQLPLT